MVCDYIAGLMDDPLRVFSPTTQYLNTTSLYLSNTLYFVLIYLSLVTISLSRSLASGLSDQNLYRQAPLGQESLGLGVI